MASPTTSLIGVGGAAATSSQATSALTGALGLSGAGATAAVTAGIAIPIAIGLSLLASHDKRVQIAKTESGALAQAIAAFDTDIKNVATAYSNSTLSEAQTIDALNTMGNSFVQFMGKYSQASRPCLTNWNLRGPSDNQNYCWQGGKCDKGCTSGCCVACNVVLPTIKRAIEVVQAGGGTFHVCQIYNSGFGYPGRPDYPISFIAPSPVSSVESFLQRTVAALSGQSVASAVPGSTVTASSSPNMLLIIGGIVAAFILFLLVRK